MSNTAQPGLPHFLQFYQTPMDTYGQPMSTSVPMGMLIGTPISSPWGISKSKPMGSSWTAHGRPMDTLQPEPVLEQHIICFGTGIITADNPITLTNPNTDLNTTRYALCWSWVAKS